MALVAHRPVVGTPARRRSNATFLKLCCAWGELRGMNSFRSTLPHPIHEEPRIKPEAHEKRDYWRVPHGQPGDAHPSDEALLSRIALDDDSAFCVLYTRYREPLIRYFFGHTGNSVSAEDLASSTLTALYERRRHFRDLGVPGGAWIWGIARRELGTYLRGQAAESSKRSRMATFR